MSHWEDYDPYEDSEPITPMQDQSYRRQRRQPRQHRPGVKIERPPMKQRKKSLLSDPDTFNTDGFGDAPETLF